ncbi:hypothetical protein Q7P37_002395 [Cladosporium fusiforme]
MKVANADLSNRRLREITAQKPFRLMFVAEVWRAGHARRTRCSDLEVEAEGLALAASRIAAFLVEINDSHAWLSQASHLTAEAVLIKQKQAASALFKMQSFSDSHSSCGSPRTSGSGPAAEISRQRDHGHVLACA